MSSLYQSPLEVQQETDSRVKGGGGWGADWFTDRVSDGIKWNPKTGQYDSTGAAFWLGGLVQPGAREAIEQGKTKRREAEKIEAVIDSSPGLTDEQIKAQLNGGKLTGKNVKGVVAEAVRTRAEKPTPTQQAQLTEVTESRKESNEIARQQLQATIASTNSTNERLLAQGAQAHQLALIQAADARDANAQTLELQRQQMIREDQRYNERMEKLDRKDRMQGRQSLIAGLAALGAAFAL